MSRHCSVSLSLVVLLAITRSVLSQTPLATTEDPAGRGYFSGFADGSIDVAGEVDLWRFTALAGDVVAVAADANGSSLNARLDLQNAAGGVLVTNTDSGPGTDAYISTYGISSSGTYDIKVTGQSNSLGSYTVRLELVRGIDLESDTDHANDSIGGADPLSFRTQGVQLSATTSGTIMAPEGSDRDNDRFALRVLNPGNVVELTTWLPGSSTLWPRARLLDSSGTPVADEDGDAWDGHFLATIGASDFFYAEVESAGWVVNGQQYLLLPAAIPSAANALATSLGGFLITIEDQAEAAWVSATFSRFGHLWIGLTDEAEEGTWVWSSGSASEYRNWAGGDPGINTSYNQAFVHSGNGLWYHGATSTSYISLLERPDPGQRDGLMSGTRAQYLLDVAITDAVPPRITALARLPAASGSTDELLSSFTVTVSEALIPATVNAAGAWTLVAAGADGNFGTEDDLPYTLVTSPTYGGGTSVSLLITDGPMATGQYRLSASASITDGVGTPLDGNGDGVGGDAFNYDFAVALDDQLTFEGRDNDALATATELTLTQEPAGGGFFVGRGLGSADPSRYAEWWTDQDWWRFEALAGDRVSIRVDTPNSNADPYLEFYNAAGANLVADNDAGPWNDAYISGYLIPADGVYYARVGKYYWASTMGNYEIRIDLARGVDAETDASYHNDVLTQADGVTLTTNGNVQTATVAGVIMDYESGNTDEDLYWLGVLNSGNVVELTARLPDAAGFDPLVRLLDASGAPVTDADNTADGHFLATLTADGVYYAQIQSRHWVREGRRYELTPAMSWTAADAYAQSIGGYLTTIDDAAEQAWLYSLVSTFGVAWIGLTDAAEEGNWQWSDGSLSAYRNWAPGEPNSGAAYDAAYLNNGNGYWYDQQESVAYRALVESADPTARATAGPGPEARYLLDISLSDPVPPRVTSVSRLPEADGVTDQILSSFGITVSEALAAGTVNDLASWDLREAGEDGNFDTADDVLYQITVSPAYATGTSIALVITDGPLGTGHYRLTLQTTVTDVVDNPFDGDGNGTGGDPFVLVFNVQLTDALTFEGRDNDSLATATELVLTEEPAGGSLFIGRGFGSADPAYYAQWWTDEDWWRFDALAGDRLTVRVDTPNSSLDPYFELYNPAGNYLLAENDSGPWDSAMYSGYLIPEDGTYFVRIGKYYWAGGPGSYEVRVDLARGIDAETDNSYHNDSLSQADGLTLVQDGNTQSATVAGLIMDYESGNTDEDLYWLGVLNSGNVVELTTRLPDGAAFDPLVQVLDSAGAVVTDEDGADDGHFLATLTADGIYYARVQSRHWVRDGRRYEFTGAMTWPAADAYARSIGGYLTTIDNAGEQAWLYSLISTFGVAWIGLTDAAEEGNWQWSDGSLDEYRNWAPGEPNSGDAYDAAFLHSSNGYWYDQQETTSYRALVESPDPTARVAAGPGPEARYLLDVALSDPVPPRVTAISRLPASDEITDQIISSFNITLSEALSASSINAADSWDLREAGTDGTFDTADDVLYQVTGEPDYASGTGMSLFISDGPLSTGSYRLTIRSSVTDVVGNALDGDGDGVGGDDLTRTFGVLLNDALTFEGRSNETLQTATPLTLSEEPAGSGFFIARGAGSADPAPYANWWRDQDWWQFDALAGDRLTIRVDTPFSGADPYLEFYNAAGTYLLAENDAGPWTDAMVSGYLIPADGAYYVRVGKFYWASALGNYEIRVDLARGLDAETDASYHNDSLSQADGLTLSDAGNTRTATVAGVIMDYESGNTDEDLYWLGVLNAGSIVELTARLPANAGFNPWVHLLDDTGNPVADEDTADDGHFLATLTADGTYYARIQSRHWLRAGRRYELTGTMSWTAADAYARSIGGYLTTINDAGEQAWLYSLVSTFGVAWIGLTDAAEEGNWQWSDGSLDEYRNWAPGEPNNGDAYDAAFLHSSNGYWYDQTASTAYRALIESPDPTGRETGGPGPEARYLLDISLTDPVPPRITAISRLPSPGGVTEEILSTFSLTISEVLAAAPINDPAAWDLREAGVDETFDTDDDVLYQPILSPTYTTGTTLSVLIDDGPLGSGRYRLMLLPSITDVVGNPLDGDGDGVGGDAMTLLFEVQLDDALTFEGRDNDTRETATLLPLTEMPTASGFYIGRGLGSADPARYAEWWTDQDWWRVDALAGDRLTVRVDTPHSGADPYLEVYNPAGAHVVGDNDNGPSADAMVSNYLIPADGAYYLRVGKYYWGSGFGNYELAVDLTRGIDMEYDPGNYNRTLAQASPVTLTVTTGDQRTGTIAGVVVDGESGIVDQDVFDLGDVVAGETVLLSARLPQVSTLSPVVEIRDAANQVVSIAADLSDAVARADISVSGRYYAIVLALGGEGTRGHYLLDAAIQPTADLDFADLLVTEVRVPAEVGSGGAVTIEWTVSNVGAVVTPTSAWSDQVVISGNDRLGDQDDLHLSFVSHQGLLEPQQSYEGILSTALPLGVAGDLYVLVKTDAGGHVAEFIFESNNVTASAEPMTITPTPYADLRASDVLAPAETMVGNELTIEWIVANTGNGTTGNGRPDNVVEAWSDRIVFSHNDTFGDSDDVVIAEVARDGALAASDSYNGSWTGTAPAGLAGNYNVFVQADSGGAVYEGLDAADNVALGPGIIAVATGPWADLVVTALESPAAADVGAGIAIEWTVRNTTDALVATPVSNWVDRVVLSQDEVVGNIDDWTLATVPHSGALAPDSTYVVPQSVVLPMAAPGSYNLFVITDAANDVYEFRFEGNNVSAAATIELQAPDLVIDEAAVTQTVAWFGDTVDVSWTVRNASVDINAGGPWADRIWLSADAVFDRQQDIVMADINAATTPLAPGASYQQTATATVPVTLTLADGDYTVFVEADGNQRQVETDEANNATAAGVLSLSRLPGPAVISMTPEGTVQQPIDTITLVFDTAIDATTFNHTDVSLRMPSGTTIPVTVRKVANDTFALNFSSRTTEGTYQLMVGPQISDLRRNPMDQNDNGVNGEAPADAYTNAITIDTSSLPDLSVSDIVAPAAVAPGDAITVSWTVVNTGQSAADATWTDSLWLSADAVVGNDRLLAAFTYTSVLDSATDVVRSETMLVPPDGPAGNAYVIVTTDSGKSLFERDETNNATVDDAQISVTPALTLSVPATHIRENAAAMAATLSRNGSTSAALTATLTSSDDGELTVPASVTFGIGQSSVSVPLTPQLDNALDDAVPVLIEATAAGYSSAGVEVTVDNIDITRLTLELAAGAVQEGNTVTATITRIPSGPDPLALLLYVSNTQQLRLPPSATIPAGQASVSVDVTAIDDSTIENDATYTITVGSAGLASVSKPLLLLDNDVPGLSVSVIDTSVSESAGPMATTVTVRRDAAADTPLYLSMTSSDTSALTVPATALIAPFQTAVSFPAAAIDDTLVDGTQDVDITVFVRGSQQGPVIGQPIVTQVAVTDDDGPTLALRLSRSSTGINTNPAATGTVTRNGDTSGELTVALVSADPTLLTVPAEVVIPDGNSSADFALATLDRATLADGEVVTVTAAADGYTGAAASLVVTDAELPDLVVARVDVPAAAVTETYIDIAYRIENHGTAPATGSWLQRVLISDDDIVGNDRTVSQYTFIGEIPSGLYFERVTRVRTPSQAGPVWIIVTVDVADSIDEVREDNNALIVTPPLVVDAAYSATVSTDIDVAPSGTPIPLSGHAVLTGSGAPAAFVLVNIHLRVGNTERTISVLTDDFGNFTTTFQPLAREAGAYEIGASHPGLQTWTVQDTFGLLGLRASPTALNLSLTEDTPLQGSLTVTNISAQALSGVTITPTGVPDTLDLDLTVSAARETLAPGAGLRLDYELLAPAGSPAIATFAFDVTSTEGAVVNVPVTLRIAPQRSRLQVTPASIQTGMLRGTQRLYTFEVSNVGGIATGAIQVALPPVPWLRVASALPMPALAPGASAMVDLQLTPPADLALGPHTGTLVVTTNDASVTVPFTFRAKSEATGSVTVEAVDEFTYYGAGAPKIAGASVTVRDRFDGTVVATDVTDGDGTLTLADIAEGWYDLTVRADGHASFRQQLEIVTGETQEVLAFLNRELVRYIWTVTPIEIEDRTVITIESEFETNVPAPVITVEPTVIDLSEFPAEVSYLDLTITNHGLIAAEAMRLHFDEHPSWQITPLIEDIGQLPAKSSITVPLTITRLANPGRASDPCSFGGSTIWELICGIAANTYGQGITARNANRNCYGTGGVGGLRLVINPTNGSLGGSGSSGPGGGGTVYSAPTTSSASGVPCDPCWLEAIVECLIGYTPAGCAYAAGDCLAGLGSGSRLSQLSTCAGVVTNCLGGPIVNTITCGLAGLNCWLNGREATPGRGADPIPLSQVLAEALAQAQALQGGARAGSSVTLAFDRFQVYLGYVQAIQDFYVTIIGDETWYNTDTGDAYIAWIEAFNTANTADSEDQQSISSGERATLLAMPLPEGVSAEQAGRFIDRWNRSFIYWEQGIRNLGDVPDGQSTDFIAVDVAQAQAAVMQAGFDASADDGYDDPVAGFIQAKNALFAAAADNDGICARVQLKIEQEAVISRDAFDANLEIINDSDAALEALDVEIYVLNELDQDVTDLFGIRAPVLQGLADVDGTGIVAAGARGNASWILIPTSEAAPQAAVVYRVGGVMSYVQDGEMVTVPLEPVGITVLPNPNLVVDYFHQRDVFSDDPFTDEIEPSVPYSLAVMVRNTGFGTARNMRITSAQPEIVENEKGLLIDFTIIASEVNGQNLTPSMTVNFGNIEPGGIGIARWLLTSSLHGLFTSYDASFEHIDDLGDPRLSLFERVDIHEMIRLVNAPDAFDDGRPDFLVNDLPDGHDLPDTIYLSDGSVDTVNVVTAVTTEPSSARALTYTLTATVPGGWVYLRFPDPGNGQLRLTGVERSDQAQRDFTLNAWTTDRTFIGAGQRPIYENLLHLLDYDSSGSYVLHYETLPPADSTPPTSSVAALPAASGTDIPVSWSGTDDTAIASYDIFVAVDDGPFDVWLQDSQATSGVYPGVADTTVAFYSIARDLAGNLEAAPETADASTHVNVVNTPPTIAAITDRTLNEGDVLRLTVAGSDSDGNVLSYGIGQGTPSGVTINSTTGELVWRTGEEHGGGSYNITVVVADNGSPSLTATTTFAVTVNETNSPPRLDPITVAAVNENEKIIFSSHAEDSDAPSQRLTYALEGSVPPGATFSASTGVFRWLTGFNDAGTYVVTVAVTDNGATPARATRTVALQVIEVTDPPIARDDAGGTYENVPFTTANVLANDEDPDTNDTITITAIDTSATLGLVQNNGDGTFRYNPNGQFDHLAWSETATDHFTYTIADGYGGLGTAEYAITVNGLTREVPLSAGWTLAALPVQPTNPMADAVLDAAHLQTAGRQVAEVTAWTWRNGRYQIATELDALTGYWVYIDTAAELTVDGVPPAVTQASLQAGWNLVGTTVDGMAWTRDDLPLWGVADGKLRPMDTLYLGQGYWIYTADETTVELGQ